MNMLIVVLILVLIIGLLLLLRQLRNGPDAAGDYLSRLYLFTAAERSFLGVLEQTLNNSPYRAFGKVNLADLVRTAPGLTPSRRLTAKNRIDRKHVDFVLCKTSDLAIVGVVELDDRSHERKERIERDSLVDRVLAQAGIPLLRIPARPGYTVARLREQLCELLPDLAVPDNPPAVPQPAAATPAPEPAAPPRDGTQPQAQFCPSCSSVMVKRQATKGKYAGKWFWACSTFPDCRQVVALETSLFQSDTVA